MPSAAVLEVLHKGVVIPACLLALDADKRLDEVYQRAIIRYYCAAGVGGIAVGVHTTQFEIRHPDVELFQPVLKLAATVIDEESRRHNRTIVKIAGICGTTRQAAAEAESAASMGYDLGLLSLAALKDATDEELLRHCRAVSEVIPLMGFYLQPAVGGRILPHSFWRRFVDIPNVAAIKIAPFNRYQTLDVVRAVAVAGVEDRIALYTGNDDNIIVDLLTVYTLPTHAGLKRLRIKGGLLGQWSIWTSKAVELLGEIHAAVDGRSTDVSGLLEKNVALTDANSVVFDAAHNFTGCIPGIHEVLQRQGLMKYAHCVDPTLSLSPGQSEELDRIYRDYLWLTDDEYVKQHLGEWLQ